MAITKEEARAQINEQRKTGGAAFPVLYISSPEPGDYRTMAEGGMTLRDYFAAKALQGAMTSIGQQSDDDMAARLTAKVAYFLADAMLAERIK